MGERFKEGPPWTSILSLVVPILFPLREGGIWAPCEGASILEKAQIP